MPTEARLKTIINHVFLPPQLPGSGEDSSHHRSLIETIIAALKEFVAFVGERDKGVVSAAIDSMLNFQKSQDELGRVSEEKLLALLNKFGQPGKD